VLATPPTMSFDPGDAVSRSLKMMDQFYVAVFAPFYPLAVIVFDWI